MGISLRGLMNMVDADEIPVVRIGVDNVRFSVDDLRTWIRERSTRRPAADQGGVARRAIGSMTTRPCTGAMSRTTVRAAWCRETIDPAPARGSFAAGIATPSDLYVKTGEYGPRICVQW